MAAVTLVVAPRCCHWVAKHVCVQLLVHTPLVPVFCGVLGGVVDVDANSRCSFARFTLVSVFVVIVEGLCDKPSAY